MQHCLKLAILLLSSISLTQAFRSRSGGFYQALPPCARDNSVRAERCARDKSGVTVADQGNKERVCCYEWILEDCWDELNRNKCPVQDFETWQRFKQDSIASIESAECRHHHYQPGLQSCSGSFYRPGDNPATDRPSDTDSQPSGAFNIMASLLTMLISASFMLI